MIGRSNSAAAAAVLRSWGSSSKASRRIPSAIAFPKLTSATPSPASSTARRLNSSSSTQQANLGKGQADPALLSQQAAEHVGRQAADELDQFTSQPFSADDKALRLGATQGARGGNRSSSSSSKPYRQAGSSISSRLRSIISGSNKGAPSNGRGASSGRGANVLGATSHSQRSRPSLSSANRSRPVSGTNDDSVASICAGADTGFADALIPPLDRAFLGADETDAVVVEGTKPYRRARQEGKGAQRTYAMGAKQGKRAPPIPEKTQMLLQDEEVKSAKRKKKEQGKEGLSLRAEDSDDALEAAEGVREDVEEGETLPLPPAASARRSVPSSTGRRLIRDRAYVYNPHIASSNAILPQLRTDWHDPLTQAPASTFSPLNGHGHIFGRPPVLPRFPGMGSTLQGDRNFSGTGSTKSLLQPIVVPGHLRHKQAMHLLKVVLTSSTSSGETQSHVGRIGWESQLASPSAGATAADATSTAPALTAAKGAGHDNNNKLVKRIRSERKRAIAENVGGDYSRYVVKPCDSTSLEGASGRQRQAVTTAVIAIDLNDSLAIDAKQFLRDGIAEKLKEMRA
ncbi:hypothetical protein K437DRAFT_253682 [Tilletiaria anomala UBC 951]|uniref:Uncharacterized protein n=1 Tax=Tilletiaria anomala (strain ATCC 24038 / CBS 436.72 / UBC 951) TaxID=1037660 RepID=A0A066WKD0_TILAU|nr:uncharacterized protein K437DRAFT_253682 [Tilletiaria anomala UBC 951]KDN53028.1 hypothetical protein K437DRAFT_253682 [Tilletiaria anomala UBC 951]